MSEISDLLDDYGIEISESDLVEAFRSVLQATGRPRATALPLAETEFLAAHSGVEVGPADTHDRGRAVSERLTEEVSFIARSLTVRALAERWALDPSRVRHRARDGALYGVRVGRALRFPNWQFDGDLLPIPHLASVLEALPDDLHPAEVEGWMTTPKPDLLINDETPTSPRDWLIGGGRPSRVIDIAGSIDRW